MRHIALLLPVHFQSQILSSRIYVLLFLVQNEKYKATCCRTIQTTVVLLFTQPELHASLVIIQSNVTSERKISNPNSVSKIITFSKACSYCNQGRSLSIMIKYLEGSKKQLLFFVFLGLWCRLRGIAYVRELFILRIRGFY